MPLPADAAVRDELMRLCLRALALERPGPLELPAGQADAEATEALARVLESGRE